MIGWPPRGATILFTLALAGSGAAQTVLDIGAFGAQAGSGADATPAVLSAVEQCKGAGAKRIVFPSGTYDFWPDRAAEEYVYASNNDAGLKRIAFLLAGLENVEIDGQGSSFIFHGNIDPFVVERSRNITLKNFSIDWKRPFHNEALITAVREDGIDLEISEQFPYRVDKGLLFFLGENGESCGRRNRDACPVGDLLEFDTLKRETAYMVRDYYYSPYIHASVIGPRRVRIVEPGFKATAGNTLIFGMTNRDYPAFTLSDNSSIKLDSVTIHHAGGMGVIAQRCRDIELNRVQVTPSAGRMVSVPADATHFVSCSGRIAMTNCRFENQLDDATNIHGIYAQVTRRVSPEEIEVKLVHPQQRGVSTVAQGDTVEFVHADSLLTFGQSRVTGVNRTNDEYASVKLGATLPAELKPGDVIAGAAAYPDVLIRNCTIRNNRARGLLLGSRGKIVIEDNLFHTPGAAILLEGDARYWFEQAGVRDLTIRRNTFDNCNYGVWGKAAIEVGAGIDPALRDKSRYNRNITVEDNVFRIFDQSRLVLAYSVDGLTIRNNRIEITTAYPARKEENSRFDIVSSGHVTIGTNN
jgi:hypothetical protein